MGRPRKSGRAAETPAAPAAVCPHCGSAPEKNVLANQIDFIEEVLRIVLADKNGTITRAALDNLSGTAASSEQAEDYVAAAQQWIHKVAQMAHPEVMAA